MKTKKELFRDILLSANTNCVLKIKLKNAENPIITAVDKVLKNKIILKPTCLYGYKLKKRTISLLEIESIIRYHACFNQPLFVKLRYIKNHISDMRNNRESFNSRHVKSAC
jgi:hypothetical protein